jgi:branched-chain amino acid transport system substrate-binding protein
MRIKGRMLGALLGALAVAGIAVSAAAGAHRADPGITKTSIHIGGTFPLTGVASLYKTIPAAEGAYYAYVNAHGGVNGRKINFTVLDDAYDPSKTVPLTQQLVEQNKVFAVVGSLGTAPNLATWTYLNSKGVPQVLLATGDSYWGFCETKVCAGSKHPLTMGWQPDYPGEGRLYGQYIAKNTPNAKIGVLYQNDAYGQNYFAGLKQGLGAKRENIVDAESYDISQTSLVQQILALKSKGADTFVVFGTPSPTITALVTATKVGWNPTTYINNVSDNRLFMLAAAANGANVDGVISTNYVASQTTQPTLAGIKLANSIISQYAPDLMTNYKEGDGNIVYGLGVGWTFVWALQHAGKNPTRASLMTALHSMKNVKNPFLYPGILMNTSATDAFPIEQEIMIKWSGGAGGDWHPFGKLINGVR